MATTVKSEITPADRELLRTEGLEIALAEAEAGRFAYAEGIVRRFAGEQGREAYRTLADRLKALASS